MYFLLMYFLLMYFLPIYCLLLTACRLSLRPKRLLPIPKPAGPNSASSRCRYLAAGTEDASLRVMERVARIELAPTAWKAEVLPLNYTRVFFNPLAHRVPAYLRGSALLLSSLPFALKPSLRTLLATSYRSLLDLLVLLLLASPLTDCPC